MKKLFILFIAFIVFGCKKSDTQRDVSIYDKTCVLSDPRKDSAARIQNEARKYKPQRQGVIFLDFDGYDYSYTSWTTSQAIANNSGLSDTQCYDVTLRVKNFYRNFNVLVSSNESDYNTADPYKRIRVCITTSYEWYGRVGGVAFINSFTWGDNTPCFVFSSLLNYNTSYIAFAAAHEAGHTLCLQHQAHYDSCVLTYEYNPFPENNGINYIMGKTTTAPAGFGYGTTPYGCTSYQDDIAILNSILRK